MVAISQTTAALAEKQHSGLISSWLVSVEGDKRTRTLRVTDIVKASNNEFLLEAAYGITGENLGTIKAEISQVGQEVKMILVNQADTKIVTVQQSETVFSGTATLKNGVTKKVTITKVFEDEALVDKKTNNNEIPNIKKNEIDVPTACGAFLGGWSGAWPNVGQVWLWIVEVDAKCNAKYSYGVSVKVPNTFRIAEIKNGILSIPRPSGTSSFEIQKNELVGQYSGSDGTNSGTLQKINVTDGSLGEKRTAQLAAESSTPINPSTDVPKDCADFFGTWSGSWSQGNFGEQWLRVISVDNKCVAKYSYLPSKNTPRFFETVEIKKGILSFICNKSTGGICNFERRGEKIWGNYNNSGGGSNSGVFQKIE